MVTDADLDAYAARMVAPLSDLSRPEYQEMVKNARRRGVGRPAATQTPLVDDWRPLAACLHVDGDWVTASLVNRSNMAIDKRVELAVCGGCVVNRECLKFAKTSRQKDGIWGGQFPHERRRVN